MTATRTVLEGLVRQRHLTWAEAAERVAAAVRQEEGLRISLSARHFARIARRERGRGQPTPMVCRGLQYAFGLDVTELLAEPAADDVGRSSNSAADDEKDTSEVLIVAAERARRFVALETTTAESVELLHDEVRDLVRAYPIRSLPSLIGHLVSGQETIFLLLERPQRPEQSKHLYFLASVLSGAFAKASHDLADPHAATTQLRTAWLCAEHAGHEGLRAWICGLRALVAYWAERPLDSIRHIERGTEHAERARTTSSVWLPASEARARGVLGDRDGVRDAIARAERARESVQYDDLDEMGGLAVFSPSRQLYFAADALSWIPEEAQRTAEYATRAVEQYDDPTNHDFAFGDAAGSRTSLAIARIGVGDHEGAAAAVGPVLCLPPEQRINGIVQSVHRVHSALARTDPSQAGRVLQEEIENYMRTPLRSLPR